MTLATEQAGCFAMTKIGSQIGMMRRHESEQGDSRESAFGRILASWPRNGTVDLGMGILILLLARTASRQQTRLSDLRRLVTDQPGLDDAVAMLGQLGAVRFLRSQAGSGHEDDVLVPVTDSDVITAWRDHSP
ncbi:hypothetical protein [Neorhizobium sp. DT-125]|uniref:hypothetical protein n=1 Tax=Neorhizobium sp. DT-125 TaxID=3396163 RepID=UPI003F1BB518